MKLFAWDLHGTLEHGNDRVVIDISNQVLAARGYSRQFSYADSGSLYGRPWKEYFTWLLGPGDDARDTLLRDACTAIADRQPLGQPGQVTPTPHAHAVLRAIRDAGHDQVLISNARETTLRVFMRALGYADFFPEGRAFAAGAREPGRQPKEEILSALLRDPGEYDGLIVIGDSARDMDLADLAGGTGYLFAHPGTRFPECRPDHRIRDLRHLLACL